MKLKQTVKPEYLIILVTSTSLHCMIIDIDVDHALTQMYIDLCYNYYTPIMGNCRWIIQKLEEALLHTE